MKILLKRNTASATTLPSSLSVGEPLWFKDILYVGSVGTSAGGTAAAGTPVRVAMYSDLSSIDHNQTVKGNGTSFGADDAIDLVPGSSGRITVTADTTNKKITLEHADPGTAGSTTYTKVSIDSKGHVVAASSSSPTTLSGYGITDAKIESGVITLGSSTITPLTTFNDANNYAFKTITGANSNVTTNVTASPESITAGSNTDTLIVRGGNTWIHIAADSTDQSVTIGHAVGTISTTTSTGSVGTGTSTIDIPTYTYDNAGHITAKDTKTVTITIPAAVDGAMTYRGTTGTMSGSTLSYTSTATLTPDKGDTLVAASAVTITPIGSQDSPKTTLAGKQIAGTDTSVSIGDMFIYDGSNWQLVPSGDATVTNGTNGTTNTATISASNGTPSETTVGTVDGVDLKIKVKHHNPSGASVQSNKGQASDIASSSFYGSTITIPYMSTDVDGHVTSLATHTVTVPSAPDAPGQGDLKVQANSGQPDVLFNANQSGNTMLQFVDGTNTTVTQSTSTATGTTTVTVNSSHPSITGASAHSSDVGGVSSNTITVPKIQTDANGHITSLGSDSWTYTAPDAPGNGALKISAAATAAATSATTTSVFTANQATGTDSTISLSNAAATGKFRYASSTIYLDEIDGGTID